MTCKEECMEQKKDGQLKDCSIVKENEQLKKDKEYLDNTNNEQTKVILELQEQIEKMKCCGNCKRIYKNCTKEKNCKQNKYKHWSQQNDI